MSTPPGYEGVTARIVERLMTGTPPLRQWMAEQIVQAEFAPLVEAAEWVLHVVNGVSKGGGPPSDAEYAEAMDSLRAALDRMRTP